MVYAVEGAEEETRSSCSSCSFAAAVEAAFAQAAFAQAVLASTAVASALGMSLGAGAHLAADRILRRHVRVSLLLASQFRTLHQQAEVSSLDVQSALAQLEQQGCMPWVRSFQMLLSWEQEAYSWG